MWFWFIWHANSSLVPGFGGVGMRSCFLGGTLTGGNRFRRYGGDCDGGIYGLGRVISLRFFVNAMCEIKIIPK